jgi:3-oxoacyl-[acyl-carrier-protein] synthase II
MLSNIYITGISSVSSLGATKEEIIKNTALNKVPDENIITENGFAYYKSSDFTFSSYFDVKRLRRVSLLSKMILHTIERALDDAGIDTKNSSQKIGLFFSTGLGEIHTTLQYLDSYIDKGVMYVSPMHFHNSVHNAPAGLAAIEFGLTGSNYTFSQKDVSFEAALEGAVLALERGKIDCAIVCSADKSDALIRESYLGFNMIKNNKSKHGFIPSEGAAAFILEKKQTIPKKAYSKLIFSELKSVPALPWEQPSDIKDIKLPEELLKNTDVCFTGESGFPLRDRSEDKLFKAVKKINPNIKKFAPKLIFGDFPTSSAVSFYLSQLILSSDINSSSISKDIKSIVHQSITCGGSYSISVVKRPDK